MSLVSIGLKSAERNFDPVFFYITNAKIFWNVT